MKILDKFTGLLLTPFISAVTSLFPSLSQSITDVMAFLRYAFSYVTFARDLLLIPAGAMVLFFDYLLIKYSIYLVRLTIKLGIKTYITFKI